MKHLLLTDAACPRIVFFVTVTAALLSVSLLAQGEDKKEAKRFFDNGNALFVEGRYAEATSAFRSSVDLYPTVSAYYNLANCYTALQQYAKALKVIGEIQKHPSLKIPKEMLVKINAMEKSVRSIVGTLNLHVEPDGATLYFDGENIGLIPLREPLYALPGEHLVEVRLDGFLPSRERVLVVSGKSSTLDFRLTPLPASVSVNVDADGADISVDGVFAGKTPLTAPLTLSPGRHVIAVSKPGYERTSRNIALSADEHATMTISLVPVTLKSLEPMVPLMQKSFETKEGADNATDVRSRRVKRSSALVWSGAAATGLCAAGFVAFIASAKHRKDSLDKYNTVYVNATNIDTINDADTKRQEDRRRGLAYNRAALGFGVATGVFAVGTVVAGVLMKRAQKDQTKKETSVSFFAGALEVRF